MSGFTSSQILAGINAFFDWSSQNVLISFSSLIGKFHWTARTSSVLLVAGVGSYCAYRICSRYLGKDFVWTLLDSSKCDLLSRSDSRLLHPAGEGFYTRQLAQDEFHHRLLRDYLREGTTSLPGSTCSGSAIGQRKSISYTMVSPDGKVIRVIRKDPLRRHLRSSSSAQGFAALPPPSASGTPAGLYEANDDCCSVGTRSDITSVSRRTAPTTSRRVMRRRDDAPAANNEDDGDTVSLAPSDRSASLHLVWEGDPSWDDEFANDGVYGRESPTPSDISEMSAFKRLQTMLDVGTRDISSNNLSGMFETDVESIAGEDMADMIRSKCSMGNVGYMYQSVVVPSSEVAPSEVASICSERSSFSTFSQRLSGRLKDPSQRHWEISSQHSTEKDASSGRFSVEREKTPTETECHLYPSSSGQKTPMTDSVISRSSASTSSGLNSSRTHISRRPLPGEGMFDSAIVTDFVSSEDDASSVLGLGSKRNATDGVLRRVWLDKINEKPSPKKRAHSRVSRVSDTASSIAASEQSLEWCDHGFQESPKHNTRTS